MNETLRLRVRVLEGHNVSGSLPLVATFRAASSVLTDVSWTGVNGCECDGDGDGDGDCGVVGRLLSVDTGLVETGRGVFVHVFGV
ncbi:hypothetical protein HanXRQr2_Chr10g0460711 [Helianthus annuus]|uniref:Uncharacterized protein n=1 Tax=Helianthus annuus TaxID=4232 RepID=A0A9K3I0T3_HELAN|nr:hypothetical protein HanXRQr2_Chr10g0460711 [Helianthus annuus]KAJ0885399.1 hypothetical protein HanPSC8_Chr10g0444801 [Helianthus annuus]